MERWWPDGIYMHDGALYEAHDGSPGLLAFDRRPSSGVVAGVYLDDEGAPWKVGRSARDELAPSADDPDAVRLLFSHKPGAGLGGDDAAPLSNARPPVRSPDPSWRIVVDAEQPGRGIASFHDEAGAWTLMWTADEAYTHGLHAGAADVVARMVAYHQREIAACRNVTSPDPNWRWSGAYEMLCERIARHQWIIEALESGKWAQVEP